MVDLVIYTFVTLIFFKHILYRLNERYSISKKMRSCITRYSLLCIYIYIYIFCVIFVLRLCLSIRDQNQGEVTWRVISKFFVGPTNLLGGILQHATRPMIHDRLYNANLRSSVSYTWSLGRGKDTLARPTRTKEPIIWKYSWEQFTTLVTN